MWSKTDELQILTGGETTQSFVVFVIERTNQNHGVKNTNDLGIETITTCVNENWSLRHESQILRVLRKLFSVAARGYGRWKQSQNQINEMKWKQKKNEDKYIN